MSERKRLPKELARGGNHAGKLIPTASDLTTMPADGRSYPTAPAPHIAAEAGTRSIMLDVIIALLPAFAGAVYFFGWRSLVIALITPAACVACEYLWCVAMKKPRPVGDLSAVVTGLIIAAGVPATVPYYLPVVAAVFAIVVVKQLYGGLGKNFMNPALSGLAFVLLCFPEAMTSFPEPFEYAPVFGSTAGFTNGLHPLISMWYGEAPDATVSELLLGQNAGALGETSVVLLLAGGAYLMLRRVISPRIPLLYLGTVALLCAIFPRAGMSGGEWAAYNLLSGGLVFCALFCATDYVTSPVTAIGRTIYAVGCGALTVFLRYFGVYPEGVCFAILLMNACAWLLDKAGLPRRSGERAEKGE